MDGVFISDEIGVEKPGIGFFDHVFRVLGPVDRREVMIVGDSLTSDMKGAVQYGIDSCWLNTKGQTTDLPVTYTVTSIPDILPVIAGEPV